MRKILCFVLAMVTILSVLSLTSCKKGDGAPDGMQVLRAGSEYGYNIYAPEEWTVSNYGDIAAAYVSKLDSTSITFVKADAPEGELDTYFDTEMAKFPFDITVNKRNEPTTFGNASSSFKYTYSYTYGESEIGVMQIFVYNDADFYIFTYTSGLKDKGDGVSYYESYLEKVESVINSFEFIAKSGEVSKPNYTTDERGYILASDKSVCGFEMYVPSAYKVDYSSGMVSVSRDDGTSINVSKATYTNVQKETYWEHRLGEIEAIADKTVDSNGKEVTTVKEITTLTDVTGEVFVENDGALSAVKWAYAFEYTYALGGVEYHVYQVLIRDVMDGYVYTYTAKETNYATHIDEAKSILSEIKF